MEKHFLNNLPSSKSWFALTMLLAALGSFVLASPKWGIAYFAWLAPIFLLYFFRVARLRKKLLWFLPLMIATNVWASKDVAPFPLPVLLIIGTIGSLKLMVILLLDRAISRRSSQFLTTLFFPAACISNEFLEANLGGGVWGSLANSQIHFTWFTQLASVTGIWGISFMIYWFGSIVVWSLHKGIYISKLRKAWLVYSSIFILIMVYGVARYYGGNIKESRQLRVAGLSVPMYSFFESLYQDYTGKTVQIPPTISASSPLLQEINKAQIPFIETGDSNVFKRAYRSMLLVQDSLFTLSTEAAQQGASLISWSEGNCFAFRSQDSVLINRGKRFAAQHKVYLLMAMAVLTPGKITTASKFLENKALLIGPDGRVLNVFHKNNPVPFAEASIPGDGIIPVVHTSVGNISSSICYDADFPVQMRQLSGNRTELLLLPSGDWHSIAPFHTYMAMFRGIENGCSILRQVSGGLSVASDYRGRMLAGFDFYKQGKKLWIANIPIGHINTIYGKIGDVFAYACMLAALVFIGWLIAVILASGKKKTQDMKA